MIGRSHGQDAAVPSLSHTEAEALISARLDAALDPQQERALNAHLAHCRSCSVFADQMSLMRSEIRSLPRLPASPIVSRQVRERIMQPASIWDRLGGLMGGRVGFAPMAATAALLVMILGGYALFQSTGDSGHLGPTISAGTQLADNRTATSDANATTEATSISTVVPGRILTPTAAGDTIPHIQIAAEDLTPAATSTPAPTETAVPPVPTATDVPTDVPTATTEPTEVPTDTPAPTDEPTVTETAVPDPTETAEPTNTAVPTDEPTVTNTATAEPTATSTATT